MFFPKVTLRTGCSPHEASACCCHRFPAGPRHPKLYPSMPPAGFWNAVKSRLFFPLVHRSYLPFPSGDRVPCPGFLFCPSFLTSGPLPMAHKPDVFQRHSDSQLLRCRRALLPLSRRSVSKILGAYRNDPDPSYRRRFCPLRYAMCPLLWLPPVDLFFDFLDVSLEGRPTPQEPAYRLYSTPHRRASDHPRRFRSSSLRSFSSLSPPLVVFFSINPDEANEPASANVFMQQWRVFLVSLS